MAKHEAIRVISYGEPLIGVYPPMNRSIAEDVPLSKTWGGDTSNMALALTKLGHRTAYITRVGDDGFGHSFLDLWRRNGVDTSQIRLDKEHRTGLYFVSFEDGKHEFTYYRKNSAASFVSSDDIDWEFVGQAKVLHLSGISQAISTNALDVSFDLLEFAKRKGILVSYDVNHRPPLWRRETARAVILHTIAEYTDILEITEDELEFLGNGDTPETFLRHFTRKPRILAVKRGDRGACLIAGEKKSLVEPFKVDVEDTVGAGDAFDAGLIAGVLEGMRFEQLGLFASAVAALTCRGVGPLRMQPSRDEAWTFLESQQAIKS
jgi:2-dehydro-3-deoxygluconokinase